MLSGAELKPRLKKIFHKNVVADKDYQVGSISALDLLSARRLDLIPKYIYAKYKLMGVASDFPNKIYCDHIKAFNNFVENDEELKVGESDFLEKYNTLLDSIKSDGFSDLYPVPINYSGDVLDGAHRVAACLALSEPVRFVSLDVESPSYDYSYFLNRGLSVSTLDFIALNYVRLVDSSKVVILWPSAKGRVEEVESILRGYGDVVYRKSVSFSDVGQHNITRLAYKNEEWLGSYRDDFLGAKNKADWCFSEDGPAIIYLIDSVGDLVEMKEKIRELFGVGKHSVHINDTYSESLELSECLFNKNSLNVLNCGRFVEFKWFDKLFLHYRSWIEKNGYDKESFCIDGSGSLAVVGVRDVRDLDYLCFSHEVRCTGYKEIDCHNSGFSHKKVSIDDVVFDSENYFYHDGLKFVSLELVRSLKILRGEVKDKEDVANLDTLLSGAKIKADYRELFIKFFSITYIKARIKLVALKLRYHLYRLRKGVG